MNISKKAFAQSAPCLLTVIFFLLFVLVPFESQAHDSEVCSGKLSNGLAYYIHHDPYSKKHISLDFVIKAGSLDEQEEERGFSHLIEHSIVERMQFKGKKLTDLRCGIWDLSGPTIETVTTYVFTQFHFDVSMAIPRGLEEVLLGFSQALFPFSLEEQDFQVMKEEILGEIKDVWLSHIESWKEWRIAQEYPSYKHPLGNPEIISNASIEKIYQFYQKNYQPDRVAIILIGNIDVEVAKSMIEKYFGHIPVTDHEECKRDILEPCSVENSVYIDKYLPEPLISLTKPLPWMSQSDRLIYSVLTRLLSEHLNKCANIAGAKFSKPILETSRYPAMFRLTVSLDDDLEAGIDHLRAALDSCFSYPMTNDRLDLIIADMKNDLESVREKGNDPALIEFYRDQFMSPNDMLHPDYRSFIMNFIDAEHINRMIPGFLDFSHASLRSFNENAKLILPDLFSKLKNTDLRRSYVD
jgi:zinc protease